MKQKRKKMPEATVYAVKTEEGKWLDEIGCAGTFPRAMLFKTRAEAKDACGWDETIIACRVRVLPSARRNAKRNA